MKPLSLSLPLMAIGALAACQVTGPAQEPRTVPAGYEPQLASARSEIPARTSADTAPGRFDQEPPATVSRSSRTDWGPGTKNISLSGQFMDDQTSDEPSDPGDDVKTLDLEATVGTLLTERFEINVQGAYHEADVGPDEVNRTALFGGLRYYLVTPTDKSDIGVYAEGKAGVLSVDSPARDGEEFAYGASGGILWFPWGAVNGLAVDLSIDWLASDVVDRLGASAGLSYYW